MTDRTELEHITTVDEQERMLAAWIRAKVRLSEHTARSTITLSLPSAQRIAGLLEYAANAEEAR
jgi:hypothetical protein